MPTKTLRIIGKPQSAKRPRFSRRSGRAYMPHQEAEDAMTYKIAMQWKEETLDCPIELWVTYHMELPKATSAKKAVAMVRTPHTKHWDLDNGLKILGDSMLGVVYNDDCQIWRVYASKIWTEPGNGRTEIEVVW